MNKNVFSYCSAMAQARRLMCDGIVATAYLLQSSSAQIAGELMGRKCGIPRMLIEK